MPSHAPSILALLTISLFLSRFALGSTTSSSPEQCGWGLPRNILTHQPLCLDETAGSDPSTWAPWTHKPHCVEAADTPWCVYTNAALPRHDQRGISIVTTPELAVDIFDLHDDKHPLHTAFSYPAPEKRHFSPRPYEVRLVPGKGLGAVATRRIPKESVILIDHVILMATAAYPADVLHEEVQDLLRTGAGRLPDPERVRGLSVRDREKLSVEEDVVVTNSFELEISGNGYMGLFPDLARINHACNPNAHLHFSETTLAMTIWSARDIEEGEEITISYASVELTYEERKGTLLKTWGFNCTCSLCTAEKDVRDASDARRLEFRAVRDGVLQLAQKGDFRKAVEEAEKLFAIVEEEYLGPHMGDLYEIPARLYYQIGDLEKARKYFVKSMFELDGWGVPGPTDKVSLENAKGILARLEEEMAERKTQKPRKPQVYVGTKGK